MKNEVNLKQIGFLVVLLLFCTPLFSQEDNTLYASAEGQNILILEPGFSTTKTNASFEKKYHYLVARAYFKLLSEAQKAERKLKGQYEQYTLEKENFNRGKSSSFQNKLSVVQRKYEAHRAMLSGLKSWNLFSEDRTGDMFYFMVENEDRIFQMYRGDISEAKMVKFLIYKLADLYHVEGQS